MPVVYATADVAANSPLVPFVLQAGDLRLQRDQDFAGQSERNRFVGLLVGVGSPVDFDPLLVAGTLRRNDKAWIFLTVFLFDEFPCAMDELLRIVIPPFTGSVQEQHQRILFSSGGRIIPGEAVWSIGQGSRP